MGPIVKSVGSRRIAILGLITIAQMLVFGQPALAGARPPGGSAEDLENQQFQLALSRYREQNYSKALPIFNALLSHAPNNVDYLLGKAQVLLRLARVAEAQALLMRVTSISPGYEFAWSLLVSSCNLPSNQLNAQSITALARKKFPKALWLPLRELKSEPDLDETIRRLSHSSSDFEKFQLAQYLLKANRPQEALALLTALRKRLPNDENIQAKTARAYREFARKQCSAGNTSEAGSALMQAIVLTPDDASSYRLYLQIFATTGTPDLERVYAEAQKHFPKAFWTQPALPLNASIEQIKERIDQLNATLAESADDVKAVLELARAQQRLNCDALPVYEKYLGQFSPEDGIPIDAVDVLNAKAALLSRNGQTAEAVQAIHQLLAVKPDSENAWRLLLKLCNRKGSSESADAIKQQASVYFPNAFWLHGGAVPITSDGAQDFAEIEKRIGLIKTAIENQPDDAEAYLGLGKLQEALGDYDTAIRTNQQLVALSPEESEYRQRLAATYYSLARSLCRKSNGVSADAVRALKDSMTADSGYEPAYKLYWRWCQNPANHIAYSSPDDPQAEPFQNAYWRSRASSVPAELEIRAESIRQYSARFPEDSTAAYELFQVYRAKHEYKLALQTIDSILAESPDEKEYILNKVNLLNRMERPNEAVALLDKAVRSNQLSKDAEYYQILLKNALRQKSWIAYKEIHKQAVRNVPKFDWSPYNPQILEGNVFPRQELDIVCNNQLVTGRPGWNEQTIAYNLRMPNRVTFNISANRYRRFSTTDCTYNAGFGIPVTRRLTSYTEGVFGPGNVALPGGGFLQAVTMNLPWGLNAIGAYQLNSYKRLNVNSGIYTLEKYVGPFRVAFTFNNAHIEKTGVANAESLAFNWFYSRRSQIGLSFAVGHNIENVLPQNKILDNRTIGALLGGLHYVTPEWAVRYGIFIDSIQDIYTRRGLMFGLKRVL